MSNPNEFFWAETPGFPLSDWKYEVANDDTRLGYHEWVTSKRASQRDDDDFNEFQCGDSSGRSWRIFQSDLVADEQLDREEIEHIEGMGIGDTYDPDSYGDITLTRIS